MAILRDLLQDPEVHGSTSVKELFAEARIPLITDRFVKRLAIEAGYRLSWYDAEGASVSTDAYKIALDVTAVTGVRFRASQQRAVRAPNIIELFSPTFEDFFFIDPCAGVSPEATVQQCELTGLSPALYGQVIRAPPGGFFAYNAHWRRQSGPTTGNRQDARRRSRPRAPVSSRFQRYARLVANPSQGGSCSTFSATPSWATASGPAIRSFASESTATRTGPYGYRNRDSSMRGASTSDRSRSRGSMSASITVTILAG